MPSIGLIISSSLALIGIIILIIKKCLFIHSYNEPYSRFRKKNLLYFKHKNVIIEQFKGKGSFFKDTFIYRYIKLDYNTLNAFNKDNITLKNFIESGKLKINQRFLKPHQYGLTTYAIYVDKSKNLIQQINRFIFFIEHYYAYNHRITFQRLFDMSNKKYLPICWNAVSRPNLLRLLRKPNDNEDIYFISLENINSSKPNLFLKYNISYCLFTNTFILSFLLFLPLVITLLHTYFIIAPLMTIIPMTLLLKQSHSFLSNHFTQDDDFIYISNLDVFEKYILFDKKQKKFFKINFCFSDEYSPRPRYIYNNSDITDMRTRNAEIEEYRWFDTPSTLYRKLKDEKLLNSAICVENYHLNYYLKYYNQDFKYGFSPRVLQFIFQNFKIKDNPFLIKSPYQSYRSAIYNKSNNKPYKSIALFYLTKMNNNKRNLYTIKLLSYLIRRNKPMPLKTY